MAEAAPRPRVSAQIWLSLATVALLGVFLRLRLSTAMPQFEPDDDTGYFHVEGAFQYRYAKLLAFGREVPPLDTAAQYPEGVRVGREISLLMERATAASFRLLGGGPPESFHRFVVLWVCFFSVVGTAAVFVLALGLDGDPPLALACAACYAASWTAGAVTTAAYGFQCFALPLLLACAACVARALDGAQSALRRDWWAAAAGALLVPALISWHFARFFLLTLWLSLGWAALRAENEGGRARVASAARWLLLAAALAATAPVLRETRFWASPSLLLGAALWTACALRGPARFSGLAAAALGAAWASRGAEAAAYGHVWGLLWAKLRFGLAKPADPARLSQEARLLWSGPFNSPDLGFLLFSFLPLGALALPRLYDLVRRRDAEPATDARRFFDALALLYLAGASLVSRLVGAFAFFVCAAPASAASPRRRRALAWLAAAVFAVEAAKTFWPDSPFNPALRVAASATAEDRRPSGSYENERSLIEWLRRSGRGRPVAAPFGLSASLLAYAGSPILLHPKFETLGIREKTARFLDALYSDESALEAYCRKYGAGLLVYSTDLVLDETSDGARYMSGRLPLRRDSAAFRLHFEPEKAQRFRLLAENEDYRVFAVGRSTEPARGGAHPAIYDLAQFAPQDQADGTVALDIQGALKRRQESRLKVLVARLLMSARRPEQALALYQEAFAAWPPDERLRKEYDALRMDLEARQNR